MKVLGEKGNERWNEGSCLVCWENGGKLERESFSEEDVWVIFMIKHLSEWMREGNAELSILSSFSSSFPKPNPSQ